MWNRLLWTWNGLVELSALLVLTLYPGLTGVAAQPITCGSVITQDTVLQGDLDLSACSEPSSPIETVLTLVGPAVLDLNEFELRCGEPAARLSPDGKIVVEGERARIVDGDLVQCVISLWGAGRHRLDDLSTSNESSIEVYSNRNTIRSNDFSSGGVIPLVMFSDSNLVIENRLITNGTAAPPWAIMSVGSGNIIYGNSTDSDPGIQILGNNNRLMNNSVVSSSPFPSLVISGERSFVLRNAIMGGDVRLHGNRMTFVSNRFTVSGGAHRLSVVGDGNKIVGNTLDGLSDVPSIILPNGSERNIVVGNTLVQPLSPLVDENLDCDRNIWRANRGGVGNQTCVR